MYLQIVPDGINMNTKVEHAREDPYLCGPHGLYFSAKDVKDDVLK